MMKIKVLGLCSYPVESAATRYRLIQFIKPLAEKNIEITVLPFLDSEQFRQFYKDGNKISKILNLALPFVKHFLESVNIKKFDLIFVQREAMFFGPAFFESLFQRIGKCPLILDLDDATYISYTSPTYGKIGSFFKFFGKTDKLIKRADTVICGNRFIAEYVESKSVKTVIVPTIVDTDIFQPIIKNNETPVIGWIGTHSTFPSLASLFPILKGLSAKYDFKLKVVGAGEKEIKVEGIEIENLEWNLEREVEDFQSLDIGLYPIKISSSANEEWIKGKSGFKAIQYMSVGIPFVVTPVGVCNEIGIANKTHYTASDKTQWHNALEKLLQSSKLRNEMGEAGRIFALDNYTVEKQSEKIAGVFQTSLENFNNQAKM